MKNLFLKLNFRFISLFLGIILIGFIVLSGIGTYFLLKSKSTIEGRISSSINGKAKVDQVFFIAPNIILARNVFCWDKGGEGTKPILSLNWLRFDFSLIRILAKKEITPLKIVFYKPKINYQKFIKFFEQNRENIMAAIAAFPQAGDITIDFRNVLFSTSENPKVKNNLIINSHININQNEVSSKGSLKLKNIKNNNDFFRVNRFTSPVKYKLKGNFNDNFFIIEKLDIFWKNFFARFWGKINDSSIKAEAYTKYHEDFQGNISLLASIKFPSLLIKKIIFYSKNATVETEGNLMLLKPIFVNTKTEVIFSDDFLKSSKGIKKITNLFRGNILNGRYKGKVFTDLFLRGEANPFLQAEFFTDELPSSDYRKKNVLFFDKIILKQKKIKKDYNLTLKNVKFKWQKNKNKMNIVRYSANLYKGELSGKADYNLKKPPFIFNSVATIDDLDVKSLGIALPFFRGVFGDLRADINLDNYPDFKIKANAKIKKGLLDNFDFLLWISDFFGIESLKKVNFDLLSANIIFDKQGFFVDKINLDSQKIKLKGYYYKHLDDLVSSKLSLSISEKMLAESKLRSLINILEKDVNYLTFDFQLSGLYGRTNFQWLDSAFKKRLRKRIPNFIERGIERKVEEAIKTMSVKEKEEK